MTLSSISLSLSLLNHQLSSLKITLFSLRSQRSKRSRASMLLHGDLSQHHHKDGLSSLISLFSLKPETNKHLHIWFSFPQNLKPTLRSISQRVLDDVWILVWIGVGVSPFSLSWSLRRRRGVGKWWFVGFGVDQHWRFDLIFSMWVFFFLNWWWWWFSVCGSCWWWVWVWEEVGFVEFSGVFGWGLWSLSCLGVVYFLCMWTVVCGYEFKSDLSFLFFYILLWFGQAFLQGMMTPILWWGYLMESMMTNLGSSVMVHGFSCWGGGFFWVLFEFGL